MFAKIKKFFFENANQTQTIIKNTFWLGLAEAISGFLRLFLLIYVARIMGAAEYGKFTFSIAFVILLGSIADFGLSQTATRQLVQEGENDYSSIISLRLILSMVTIVLMIVGAFFITTSYPIRQLIWILGIYIAISNFSEIIFSFFRAREKMQYEAWTKIVQAIVTTAIGVFLVLAFPSVQNLGYSYALASAIALIFILSIFFIHTKSFTMKWDRAVWKKYLLMSWPLGLMAIFAAIYTYIDSVMMGAWGQIIQTGWYNAAYKIISVVLIPGALISQSFYPAMSRGFKESTKELQRVFNKQMRITIIWAIPLVMGGIMLAPQIVYFFYGASFSPAILAFQFLIIMAGNIFLTTVLNQILVVAHQQKRLFFVNLLGAIINIILNIILIPILSLYGAALSTVATYFVLFLLTYLLVSRFTEVRPININILTTFFITIIATAIMCFMLKNIQIYKLQLFPLVFMGAIIYFAVFLSAKIIISRIVLSKKNVGN